MRLVIQDQNKIEKKNLKDYQLQSEIERIRANYIGIESLPKRYEVFRYKLPKGIAIIYQNNKILRSKNSWYEVRALTKLSQQLHLRFYHPFKANIEGNQEIEIDGVDTETLKIMVEAKNAPINQEWLNFYDDKRKKLHMNECIVISPIFEDHLKIPSNIRCFVFKPDFERVKKYYNEQFTFPELIKSYISSRHLRILTNRGRWVGFSRKLTETAKHTIDSKFGLIINNFFTREKYPVKIYYSLASMVIPTEEYFGKGYPLARVLAAIDVDSDPHPHIIEENGYCEECIKQAEQKARQISQKLTDLGKKYVKLYSGSKGFHFYVLDEKNNNTTKELPEKEFLTLARSLTDNSGTSLADNINFRSKLGTYDLHRIFKLPNSVDVSTGLLVKKEMVRLSFNDLFEEL